MREVLEKHKDWDGDPYEALMVEYVDPTTGAPVFKTITFFVQMLRPGERTRPLKPDVEPARRAFRGQRPLDRRRQASRLEAVRHAGRARRRLVRARQRLRPRPGVPLRGERRAGAEGLRAPQEVGPRGVGRRGAPRLNRARAAFRRPATVPPTVLPECPVPSAANTTLLSHIACPGGGQVWVDGTTLYIGHMRWPSGTTIVDVADPRHPKVIARIDLPEGWHSHKVRVADGIMLVNHEKLGQSGLARVRRRPRHLRRVAPGRPEAHLQMDDRRARRAPLRFRRPLRLHLADRRRLCRQHRDDPRSRRSRPSRGGRALVDSRPVARRAASPIPGTTTCRRAATIRSGRATASM